MTSQSARLCEALDDPPADDAAGSCNESDLSFHRFQALAGELPPVQ